MRAFHHNVSWTLAGNVGYSACQWGILLIIVHLGSPTDVGRFALGLAVTAPIVIGANLGLRQIQSTDAQHQYDFREYWGLRLVTTLLALLVIGVIAAFLSNRPDTAAIVLAVGVAKAIESLADVTYGLFQQRERMELLATSQLARGVAAVGGIGIGMHVGGTLVWGLAAMAVAWLTILLAYDLPHARTLLGQDITAPDSATSFAIGWIVPTFHRATLLRLGTLASPLGIVAMLNSLNANIPRYFIEAHLGAYALGIFAALAYFSVSGHLIGNALQQSASPVAGRHCADGDVGALKRLLLKLIALCLAIGLLGVLVALVAGRPFLQWVYGADYAAADDVLVLLMAGAAVLYLNWPLDTVFIATRRFGSHLAANVLNSLLLIGLSALLIPSRGLTGAAWAILAASAVTAILKLAMLRTLFTPMGLLPCTRLRIWPAGETLPHAVRVSRR